MDPVKSNWCDRLLNWRNKKMFKGSNTTGSCGPDSPIEQHPKPGVSTHPIFGPDQEIPRQDKPRHHMGGPG